MTEADERAAKSYELAFEEAGRALDQADGASRNPAERGDERLARLVEACEIIGVPRAPA
jgi:hypothetical protein